MPYVYSTNNIMGCNPVLVLIPKGLRQSGFFTPIILQGFCSLLRIFVTGLLVSSYINIPPKPGNLLLHTIPNQMLIALPANSY